jgi:hypothetical protein
MDEAILDAIGVSDLVGVIQSYLRVSLKQFIQRFKGMLRDKTLDGFVIVDEKKVRMGLPNQLDTWIPCVDYPICSIPYTVNEIQEYFDDIFNDDIRISEVNEEPYPEIDDFEFEEYEPHIHFSEWIPLFRMIESGSMLMYNINPISVYYHQCMMHVQDGHGRGGFFTKLPDLHVTVDMINVRNYSPPNEDEYCCPIKRILSDMDRCCEFG